MSTLTLSLLTMILKISPLIFELSYMNHECMSFLADQRIRDQHKLVLCFTLIITSMYALYTHYGILSNLGDLALFVLMHFTMREESCLLKYTYLHLFLTNYC